MAQLGRANRVGLGSARVLGELGRLARELDQIARLAGQLRIWAVIGGIHPADGGERLPNCVHVISGRGEAAGTTTSACSPRPG